MNLEEVKSFCHSLIPAAGAHAVKLRQEGALNSSYKSSRDLVTAADHAVERQLLDAIGRAFPGTQFLAEESSNRWLPEYEKTPLWIIDPIDGTVNFSRSLNHWAVSVALYYEGQVQYGMVHAPDLGETYEAVRGRGATCNGTPLHCRAPKNLEDALLATGFPYRRDQVPELLSRASRVLSACADLRRFGAASVDCCLVARGALDGYYEDVAPWDIAAGALIVREAGGITGNYRTVLGMPGELQGTAFLAAAPTVYPALQKLLAGPEAIRG